VNPAHPLPLVDRGYRDLELSGQIRQPELVLIEQIPMTHRCGPGAVQPARTPQASNHVAGETSRAFGRMKSFSVQVLGNLLKAATLGTQLLDSLQQLSITRQLVVARDGTYQAMLAGEAASPLQLQLHVLALAEHVYRDPLQKQSHDLLTVLGSGAG